MRYWLLFALMTLSLSGFAQTREQVEVEGEVEIEGVPSDNSQEGDLNTNTQVGGNNTSCLLYTSPSPRDGLLSRMPSSA